jgi:hypothetical protein
MTIYHVCLRRNTTPLRTFSRTTFCITRIGKRVGKSCPDGTTHFRSMRLMQIATSIDVASY